VDVRARIRNIQWGISERGRLSLTPAAFAHFLVRGQRWQQAVSILVPLIADAPERQDLRLALSQALWRLGDRQAACELAREVQETLPNALKAALFLAEEGDQEARQRAAAMDPLAEYRRRWFGGS
jgi:predicted Zn-dependent protease